MIHIGVCDDERLEVKLNEVYIRELSEELGRTVKISIFTSGIELIQYAKQYPLEIVVLDIYMKEMSGIKVATELKDINRCINILFLTGYQQYALEAFEVDAIGYRIKPVDIKKFKKFLEKAFQLISIQKENRKTPLKITHENIKKNILQEEILYIEKEKNQSIIYTKWGTYAVYESMTNLNARTEEFLWQVNQGLIVNEAYIKKIENNDIVLKNGKIFTLGRKFAKSIKEKYLS